jgi:hypothetical protein
MVIRFKKQQSIFIKQWVPQCDVIKVMYMIAHKIAENKTASHFVMENLLSILWLYVQLDVHSRKICFRKTGYQN